MAEAARLADQDLPHAEERPLLEVVRDTIVEAAPEVAMPNVGRSAVIGYVVGFFVVAIAITVAGTLGGLGFGASLGLGAFVGVWGGGGFGFMMGGTVPLARHLDAQARSTHHGQGEAHDPAAR